MSPLEWCEMHGVSDADQRREFLDLVLSLDAAWMKRDQHGPKELKPRGNPNRNH